ncbi:carboxylating nicotinate-nucleotide diphosphorylase [Variovorax sp. J31P207]|uniref:carboxylating nicotinate-nucleotide diphosphorylase n=1 Tax=Variovorax sp. J31P207 TaxID=3053510 RepID=UPI002578E338|nr:carboxylating nicotinate-nucleotide diphosphorylase [Variovorax sp. J31P207]MDM0066907.1 carboxylating nicotinate-nucleotide diphosphorylase [Variovorax sp. J31P207]
MNFEQNETLELARARNVRDALMEDIGRGDWTAQLVPPAQRVQAQVLAKEPSILCGQRWFEECLHALDPRASISWNYGDGDHVAGGTIICTVEAHARSLLSAERTALNFLQMLSAVATQTRAYVQATVGRTFNPYGVLVIDTRKTLPGLRQAQKYAVRVGGGSNHRMALWDGILIKENHIAAAGGIAEVLAQARALESGVDIQIEVENLEELRIALANGATNVLLDDFSLEDVHRAVEYTARRAVLEVSGGVDLASIGEISSTGVDRISIGRLTKDLKAIDLSMRVIG